MLGHYSHYDIPGILCPILVSKFNSLSFKKNYINAEISPDCGLGGASNLCSVCAGSLLPITLALFSLYHGMVKL